MIVQDVAFVQLGDWYDGTGHAYLTETEENGGSGRNRSYRLVRYNFLVSFFLHIVYRVFYCFAKYSLFTRSFWQNLYGSARCKLWSYFEEVLQFTFLALSQQTWMFTQAVRES